MKVSMFCSKRNFSVKSFGTGINVKLPGVSADRPNIYDFGITYDDMYKDLKAKDLQLYLFWTSDQSNPVVSMYCGNNCHMYVVE